MDLVAVEKASRKSLHKFSAQMIKLTQRNLINAAETDKV